MNVKLLRSYLVSPDFEQKLNHRIERLQSAEQNPVERINIMMDCREDFFIWADLFGVAYEPRLPEMPDIPMFLFPHQREMCVRMIDAEERVHDLFIEKTRDMMATWTALHYMYWRWRFKDGWYGLIGSRKEEEVDNRGPSSLFGKLRYIHYAQPQWLRPQKFRKSEHDLHLKLINPDGNAYIDGESANPNFGRGRRCSMILFDELFFWKNIRESWRSSVDSAPCRVAISTAVPSSFARGFRASMESQGNMMTLDWHVHPFKDEEWFRAEEVRRQHDPLAVMGELEISYQSDPELSYYPEVIGCKVEEFDYNPDLPLYVGTDFGSKDKSAFVYFQRDSAGKIYCLDGFERNHKKLSWYYPLLRQGINFEVKDEWEIENRFTKEKFVLKKTDYFQVEREMIARFNTWRNPVMYCGEAAHRQTMIKSNSSIAQELAGVGIMLRINDMAIAHSVRRNAVKKMLPNTVFSSKFGALDVFDALLNSKYPKSRENTTSIESGNKPVHDDYADLRSAVENFAVNQAFQIGGGVREFVYRKISPLH